jgi:hypothetical protein
MSNDYEDNMLQVHAQMRQDKEAENARLTEYGRTHGGADRATWHMMMAKLVAVIGAFAVAVPLSNSGWSINTKTAIIVGFVGFFALFDLAVLFRYFRLRYALLVVAMLVVCLAVAAGLLLMLFHFLP